MIRIKTLFSWAPYELCVYEEGGLKEYLEIILWHFMSLELEWKPFFYKCVV
jgi:hypothetical protein